MVLVKIEPKEAVRFIKLRQSFPHSWDMGGTEEGEDGCKAEVKGYMSVWLLLCGPAYVYSRSASLWLNSCAVKVDCV